MPDEVQTEQLQKEGFVLLTAAGLLTLAGLLGSTWSTQNTLRKLIPTIRRNMRVRDYGKAAANTVLGAGSLALDWVPGIGWAKKGATGANAVRATGAVSTLSRFARRTAGILAADKVTNVGNRFESRWTPEDDAASTANSARYFFPSSVLKGLTGHDVP